MPMTSKEMIKFLKNNGFVILRQKGTSHVQMRNPSQADKPTVPDHGSKTLRKGLEPSNFKAGGTKKIVLLHNLRK